MRGDPARHGAPRPAAVPAAAARRGRARGRAATLAAAVAAAVAASGAGLARAQQAAPPRLPAAIDLRGARGQDGARGADGRGAGASGGNATAARPGGHGGRLDLAFEALRDDAGRVLPGRLRVSGRRAAARPHHAPETPWEPLAPLELDAGPAGLLALVTRGGDGGHGGDGGQGARGSAGSRGRDATCSSSGGRGGDGGPGGAGGHATSGADGGDGGALTIRVRPDDTHLLLLLDPDPAPGAGGRAGRNGAGGAGGPGGAGGRSHSSHGSGDDRCSGRSGGSSGSTGRSGPSGSAAVRPGHAGVRGELAWVVGDERYDDRYRLRLEGFDFADEDGDGVYEPGEVVAVTSLTLANAGGVPTPPPDLHPTVVHLPARAHTTAPSPPLLLPVSLAAGERTTLPGPLEFRIADVDTDRVVHADLRWGDEGTIAPRAYLAHARREHPEHDRPARYPIGFPVALRPVRFASALGPGESRRVVLEVENVSRRPLGLAVDDWLAARGQAPDPARRRAVRLALAFEGEGLAARHLACTDDAGRPLDLAAGPWAWDLAALGPGEVARREVTVGLLPDAPLATGGALTLALELGRRGQGPGGAPADGATPGALRAVERRRVPLRVATRWRAPAAPGLVLVTNAAVDERELAAWQALADRLGLGLAVWDLSYHGYLPLAAPRADRLDASLREAARGHAVVVLGHAFESALADREGAPVPWHAGRHLEADAVARAASADASVLVVLPPAVPFGAAARARAAKDARAAQGTHGRPLARALAQAAGEEDAAALAALLRDLPPPRDLLVPVGEPARRREHADPDAFLAALEAEDAPAPVDGQSAGGATVGATGDAGTGPPAWLDEVHDVWVGGWGPLGRPRASAVRRAARALAGELARRYPTRRYVLVPRRDPSERGSGLGRTFRHGRIEVRRGVDLDRPALRAVLPARTSERDLAARRQRPDDLPEPFARGPRPADAGDADAAWVADLAVLEAVVRTLPFPRKLELLRGFLAGALPRPRAGEAADAAQAHARALGRALEVALLEDLGRELEAWTLSSWSGSWTTADYRVALGRHAALAALRLERPLTLPPAPTAPGGATAAGHAGASGAGADGAAEGDPRAACALGLVAGVRRAAGRAWGPLDVLVPLRGQRYFAAAAAGGNALGPGLVDDFAAGVFGAEAARSAAFGAEVARRAGQPPRPAALASPTRPPAVGARAWGELPGPRSLRDEHAAAVVSPEDHDRVVAAEARRAASAAAQLEALDRLRIATELGEGIGGPGR